MTYKYLVKLGFFLEGFWGKSIVNFQGHIVFSFCAAIAFEKHFNQDDILQHEIIHTHFICCSCLILPLMC